MEEQRLECEQQERDDAKKEALYKQWAKCGSAVYGSRWQFFAPSKVKGYVNTVTKYSSQVLTKSHPSVCGIGRLSHSSCDDEKVKRVHACKYLHLRSEHNALAKASEDYIKKSGSGLVQVNYFTDLIVYVYAFSLSVCEHIHILIIFHLAFAWCIQLLYLTLFFHRGPRNGMRLLHYALFFWQSMMSRRIIQLKTFRMNWLNF